LRKTGGLGDTVFDIDHDEGRAAWEMFGSVDAAKDGVDGRNGYTCVPPLSADLRYPSPASPTRTR
jgi:hypothetical protein